MKRVVCFSVIALVIAFLGCADSNRDTLVFSPASSDSSSQQGQVSVKSTPGGVNSLANAGSVLGLSPPRFIFPPEYKEEEPVPEPKPLDPLKVPKIDYKPQDESNKTTAKVIFTVKFYRNETDARSGNASQVLNEQKLFENIPVEEPMVNATNGELGFATPGDINFNYQAEFSGWYNLENDQKWSFDTDIPTKDLNLYAKWKQKFSIALYLSSKKLQLGEDATYVFPIAWGEKVKQVTLKDLTDQEAGFADPDDPNASYSAKFLDWYQDNGDGDFTNDTTWDFDNNRVTENIKLYGKWKPTFNVKFYLTKTELLSDKPFNDKKDQKFLETSTLTEPNLIRKNKDLHLGVNFDAQNANYNAKFLGWYKDNNDNDFTNDTTWDFNNDTVTENIKLYGKWKQTFMVRYYRYKNTPSSLFRSELIAKNSSIPSPADSSTIMEYVEGDKCFIFNGWKDAKTDTTWNFNTTIGTEDVSLYVDWNKNFYVTFYLNDQKARAGEKLDQPAYSFTIYTDPRNAYCVAEQGRKLIAKDGFATDLTPPSYTNEEVGILQAGDFGAGDNASFIGWYNLKDAKPWNFSADAVTKGVKLYGKWARTSEVGFYVNENSTSPLTTPAKVLIFQKDPEKPTINSGLITDPGSIAHPTNHSYTFERWEYGDGTTNQPWNFSTQKATADSIKIYATWDKRHHVKFYKTRAQATSNGATGDARDTVAYHTIRIANNHRVTRPANPTGTNGGLGLQTNSSAPNYNISAHFDANDRWLNAANGQPWNFNTQITGNVKLYPAWKQTFVVKFYKDRNKASNSSSTPWTETIVIDGETIGATLPGGISTSTVTNAQVHGFVQDVVATESSPISNAITRVSGSSVSIGQDPTGTQNIVTVTTTNSSLRPQFLHWKNSQGNGQWSLTSDQVTSNLKLYANWKEKFRVAFYHTYPKPENARRKLVTPVPIYEAEVLAGGRIPFPSNQTGTLRERLKKEAIRQTSAYTNVQFGLAETGDPNAHLKPKFMEWRSTRFATANFNSSTRVNSNLAYYGYWKNRYMVTIDDPHSGTTSPLSPHTSLPVGKKMQDGFLEGEYFQFQKGFTLRDLRVTFQNYDQGTFDNATYGTGGQGPKQLLQYENELQGKYLVHPSNTVNTQSPRRLLEKTNPIAGALVNVTNNPHSSVFVTPKDYFKEQINQNTIFSPQWLPTFKLNIFHTNQLYKGENILALPLNPYPPTNGEHTLGSDPLTRNYKAYFEGWFFQNNRRFPPSAISISPTSNLITELKLNNTKTGPAGVHFPKQATTGISDNGTNRGEAILFGLWKETKYRPNDQADFRGLVGSHGAQLRFDEVDTTLMTNMSNLFSQFSPATKGNFFVYTVHNRFDITGWNVSQVRNMENLFEGTKFNQFIWGWDTGKVMNMSGMFKNATSFNQNLSTWDISTVYDMAGMFEGAVAFDQDMSKWNWRPSCSITKDGVENMLKGTQIESDKSKWPVFYRQLMRISLQGQTLSGYDDTTDGKNKTPLGLPACEVNPLYPP